MLYGWGGRPHADKSGSPHVCASKLGGSDSALEIPCPGEDTEQAHDACLTGGETEAASSMCLLRAEHLFLGAEKLGWTSHR